MGVNELKNTMEGVDMFRRVCYFYKRLPKTAGAQFERKDEGRLPRKNRFDTDV